jgi:hypothetical protein
MKPEGNVEIYRVAFEAANSELNEISAEFERLRIRKEHIEKLVQVLQPLIGEEGTAPQQGEGAGSTSQTEGAGQAAVEGRGGAEPVQADPFQRRIDHVLGIGGGIRDVRKYSRQF